MKMEDMDNLAMEAEARKTFIDEAREHLDLLGSALLGLDSVQADAVLLNSIFRSIHTIKGSSRSVGLNTVGRVAHAAEDVLSALREGKLQLRPEITDALLTSTDLLVILIGHAAADKAATGEDEKFIASVCDRLHSLLAQTGQLKETATAEQGFGLFDDDEPKQPAPAALLPSGELPTRGEPTEGSDDRSIRVAQKKLDASINMAGELIVAANALQHQFKTSKNEGTAHGSMKAVIALVCRITAEVHRNAMSMRFVPMRSVLQNAPRIVRDVARTQNKLINAVISGEHTEVDRQVAEALADPLMHLIRNAADHGIETKERRLAQGKPETGQISICASREANFVIIDISDDGGGIDTVRLRAKALDAKIIDATRHAQMSDEEVLELIFVPGLSTAAKVTDISGRGVGMDVVKSTIQRLGGQVKVRSELAKGTRIRIQLPFTLAVTNAVFVASLGSIYALPVDAVVETVKVTRAAMHRINHQTAISLRGSMCVVASLASLLTGLPPAFEGVAEEPIRIIVMRSNGQTFGLAVDQVKGQREVVVKPVPGDLECCISVAGATILDDGQIALLLDPSGLHAKIEAQRAA